MAKVEKLKPPWDAAVAVICEENEASGDDLSDGICGFADSHLRSSHCLVVASLLNGHPTKCNQFHPLPAFPRSERKMVPEDFFNRNYKMDIFSCIPSFRSRLSQKSALARVLMILLHEIFASSVQKCSVYFRGASVSSEQLQQAPNILLNFDNYLI